MRIAIFIPYLMHKGGSEKLILEYMLRSKHKTFLFTWHFEPNNTHKEFSTIIKVYEKKGIKLKLLLKSRFRWFYLRNFFTTINYLLREFDLENFDIVLSNIGEIVIPDKSNSPIVTYVHYLYGVNDTRKKILQRLKSYKYKIWYLLIKKKILEIENKSWKRVSFAIFNSYYTLERVLERKLIEKEKTKVIYPGANLEDFYYSDPEDYFLMVGRISPEKRQDILIKAFAKFSKKYKDYKLILVGYAQDKKYYLYLLKLIKKYNLQKFVKIIQNMRHSEMPKIYAKSLAYLHSCNVEGFGITGIEAAASGKYIIHQLPSGNYEILKHFPGVEWVVDIKDDNVLVNEWSKRLEYFVKNQDELIEKGKENRKKIKELDLSWDRFAKEMDKTLEEIHKNESK